MLEVQQDVDRRFAEIGLFLGFLRELERLSRNSPTILPSGAQSSTILKACTFLLLYNVVESCVRSALGQTYDEIANDGLRFASSTDKIQGLWLKQQLDTPADSANHQTYLVLATHVATSIANNDVLGLDSRKLPVSGNLDADAIRAICSKHGVTLKVTKWAKGGAELSTIKDQRNALAHGHKSFSECGRDYALRDLDRIFTQARHFLRGFIRSVAIFNAARSYRVA